MLGPSWNLLESPWGHSVPIFDQLISAPVNGQTVGRKVQEGSSNSPRSTFRGSQNLASELPMLTSENLTTQVHLHVVSVTLKPTSYSGRRTCKHLHRCYTCVYCENLYFCILYLTTTQVLMFLEAVCNCCSASERPS